MAKMTKCKTCGTDIASNAKTCPSCGAPNKQIKSKKIGLILLIILGFIVIIGIVGGSQDTVSNNSDSNINNSDSNITNEVAPTVQSEFAGDCGISATAQMGSSVIGMPELKISIKNNSNKDISAIRFYAVPFDVYGEEITGWTNQNYLYTDTTIKAGKSTTVNYQFIEDSIKTVRLYVYSVYYADGSEWGNKDALSQNILESGKMITVNGQS